MTLTATHAASDDGESMVAHAFTPGNADRSLGRLMATMGPQNPQYAAPDSPVVGRGIQNRVASVVATSSESSLSSDTAAVALDSFATQFTTATRPAAAADQAGRIIRLKDPGTPEQLQVCITTSGGGHEWVTVGLASS